MTTALLLAGFGSLLLAGITVSGGGCLRSPEYRCNSNSECIQAGAQGTCGPAGFCAFTDGDCDSGLRYGDLSGPYGGQCVSAPDGGVIIDGPPDANLTVDARLCFGAGAYELCFTSPPMGTVTLAGTLDTDTDTRCIAMPASWATAGQPDACMIAANTIMVTGNLAVTGSTNRRPLVLVGETVEIGATIDVASHRSPAVNAVGAPAPQCSAFAAAPGNATGGAAGGAGGSFMRKGGNGGNGDSGASTPGGTAPAADSTPPTVLRGGCAGQPGGTGTGAPGAAGNGGGALYIAANQLSFTGAGILNASGSSGSGPAGGTNAGGSGGGSGGMIVLHAATSIAANGARLLANGGGGSAGADGGNAGNPGNDPVSSSPTSPAAGGNGAGGNGGEGGAGNTNAANGANAQGARETGGGGGGGGGYIQANHPLTGATVSPAATITP